MTTLDSMAPSGLIDARLQLHHAAQIPSSFGYTFVDPKPDWSHTSLTWLSEAGAFVSGEAQGISVGLRLADATVLVHNGNETVGSFPLDRKTLESGYTWLADTLASTNREEFDKPLVRPDHDMPTHSVGKNVAFSLADAEAFEAVSAWFDFANKRLELLEGDHPNITSVRCWPHHFDIARVVFLSPDADESKDPSVGVGLSPGDSTYAEPYWYVTHWPTSEGADFPPLPSGGYWRTKGWSGAVLQGSAFGHLDATALTDAFLESAIKISLSFIQHR